MATSPFHLIPVMDLMGGQVVAAQGGQRSQYLPLCSPFCPDSNPHTLLESFTRLGFNTVYVADLDAILGKGNHLVEIAQAMEAFPELTLWLDGGFHSAQQLNEVRARLASTPVLQSRLQLVVGTETFEEAPPKTWPKGLILSLDFGAEGFRGNALWLDSSHWPKRVIVMSLPQVGTAAGPNLELLKSLKQGSAGRELIAAGGIRNHQDMAALEALGMTSGLVATALHRGHLGENQG
jgi:phosphoribosylformimino-5-aminoimidazole carboxamide ribotide isomerase